MAVCFTPHVRNGGSRPLGGDRPPRRVRAALRRERAWACSSSGPGPAPSRSRLRPRRPARRRPPGWRWAGTFADEFPVAPNPSAGGTISLRVPPTRMPGTPTLQKGSVDELASCSALAGWLAPRVVITSLPVDSQTVNWTFTLDVARRDRPAADADVRVLQAGGAGLQRDDGREGVGGADRTRGRAVRGRGGDLAAHRDQRAAPAECQTGQRRAGRDADETQAEDAEVLRHRRRIVPRRRVQSS